MTLKWLVALVIVLALALSSSVVAGPHKRPADGDPDIYEGTLARVNSPREQMSGDTCTHLILRVTIFRGMFQVWHEHKQGLHQATEKTGIASRRSRIRR